MVILGEEYFLLPQELVDEVTNFMVETLKNDEKEAKAKFRTHCNDQRKVRKKEVTVSKAKIIHGILQCNDHLNKIALMDYQRNSLQAYLSDVAIKYRGELEGRVALMLLNDTCNDLGVIHEACPDIEAPELKEELQLYLDRYEDIVNRAKDEKKVENAQIPGFYVSLSPFTNFFRATDKAAWRKILCKIPGVQESVKNIFEKRIICDLFFEKLPCVICY